MVILLISVDPERPFWISSIVGMRPKALFLTFECLIKILDIILLKVSLE